MIFAPSATVCRLVCRKGTINFFHPVNPFISSHFSPIGMTISNHFSPAGMTISNHLSPAGMTISNHLSPAGMTISNKRNVKTSSASEAATKTKNGVSSPTKSRINVNSLDKNIELRRRFSSSVVNESSSSSDSDPQNEQKRLVIIFAYMLPKEKHLDKYRSIYFNKGFDVVTVKTSPFQFFFPTIGAHKIADNLIDQLMHQPSLSKYSDIVVHGFSVGGYQFSEVLKKLRSRAATEAEEKKEREEKMERVANSIKGTIFDSPCDVDSVPFGFSRTVAGESFLAKVIEIFIIATRSIFYSVSTKYHRSGFEEFKNNPIRVPSLFFASRKDKLANIKVIEDVVQLWEKKGIDVNLNVWDDTRHVSHYHAYPKEYTEQVEKFLDRVLSV